MCIVGIMAGKNKKKSSKKPVTGIAAKKPSNSEGLDSTTNKPELSLQEESIAQEEIEPAANVNQIGVKEPVAISNSEDVNPENTQITPSPSPPPSSALSQPARPDSPCTVQDSARQDTYPQSPKKAEPLSTTTTRVVSPRKASVSPVKISPPPRQFHARLDPSQLDDDIEDDDESESPKAVNTDRELLPEVLNEPKAVSTNRDLLPEILSAPTVVSTSQDLLPEILSEPKVVITSRDFLAEIFSEQNQDGSKKDSAARSEPRFRFASIVPRSVANGVPVSIKVYDEDQEEASKLMQQLDNLRTFLEETWANIRDSRTNIQDVKKIRAQHDYNMVEEALKLDVQPIGQEQQQNEHAASTERSIAEEIVNHEEAELAELSALQVYICMHAVVHMYA